MENAQELVVHDEGAVRWLTLNRPASKNALTLELNERLIAALAAASKAPGVRAVVLTGAGGAFCSGLDLRVAAKLSASPDEYGALLDSHFHGVIRAVWDCQRPVVAVVDGAAAGFGCDLALACDLRLGSDRAVFSELFVQRGLMPDGGGTFTLARLIGLSRAMELLLTGEAIGAEDALRVGLVNRLFPAAGLQEAARQYMAKLAEGAPLVHRAIKAAVHAGLGGTLASALDAERAGQVSLLGSKDFREGVAAFLEKRPPVFKGE